MKKELTNIKDLEKHIKDFLNIKDFKLCLEMILKSLF